MAIRRTCNPEKPVRVWHGAPFGKSSAWFEHSTDNREAAGSTPASRTSFFCGQVNRCHAGLISHASGVQLASPPPDFRQGTRTVFDGGSIPGLILLGQFNSSTREVNIEVGNTQRE